jgi:predicted phage baseplate assembly protein
MPLPLPSLDRLDFAELVAEGRAALPALAPAWTDYNAHDPGITLLELFAWLAEIDSYRLDQVPDASRRAFLRLVGVEQHPAQVAETALVFRPVSGAALTLPAATRVNAQNGSSVITFQTARLLYISTAWLQAIVRGSGGAFEDLTSRSTHASLNFYPFGTSAEPGDALYLGFDQTLAPLDTEISLWLWGADPAADRATRVRIEDEITTELAETLRLCPDLANARWDWRLHYSARTVWEFHTGNDQWQALQAVVDETRALTLTGAVRFKAPDPGLHIAGGVRVAAHSAKRFIRCRLVSGGYDCPPQLADVSLNAVLARHASDAPTRSFRSTGCAGQVFDLADQPIVAGSTQVTITLANGNQDPGWREASNWDGVGPHDPTYVLDVEQVTLRFGDGRAGRVPHFDGQITVKFQLGAGAEGNVPAKSLVRLVPAQANVTVQQPFAATGGTDAETLDAANARAVAELAIPTRATTLADYELLARAIPGLPVARAHAIADYYPDLPCIPVSGSTTVAILPPCPDDQPEPSGDLLNAVRDYFERRRLVAGEIHMVAPAYTTVAILAVLHPQPGVSGGELLRRAENALRIFFHPLRGGSDGQGWPIGRSVYRAEVLALLNGIEGVLYVDQLAMRVDDGSPRLCGNVTICRHGLVASGTHEILVDEGSACHAGKTSGAVELLQRHGCGCSRVQD